MDGWLRFTVSRKRARPAERAGRLLQFPLCESRACVQMTYCFAALVGLRRTHNSKKKAVVVRFWLDYTGYTHTHTAAAESL